jgi:uncharacterized protein
MGKRISYKSLDGVRLQGILQEPKAKSDCCVIMAHGIISDKDEDGLFVTLAKELAEQNLMAFRFDFRAHGESEGSDREMTITGEFMDLVASYRMLRQSYQIGRLGLLGASFGAGAAIIFASVFRNRPSGVVLWNPVLDYKRTFLAPETPWAKRFFNRIGYENLAKNGYLKLEDFEIGSTLIDEMKSIEPTRLLSRIGCPVLSFHGTKDSKVPFEVTRTRAVYKRMDEFIPVEGSDHGFPKPRDRAFVIERTVDQFVRNLGSPGREPADDWQ